MPTTFGNSFQEMFIRFFGFLPQLAGAAIILLLGILFAVAMARIIDKVMQALQVDVKMERLGVGSFLRKIDPKLSVSRLARWMTKWSIILITLIAVAESLGLAQITTFLNRVVLYIPNVIAAVLILLIGITIGSLVERLVGSSLIAASMKSSEFLATLAKWSVVIFSFLIAVAQLGIAPGIINTLVAGFVAMIALAGGLAFGLGGQEYGKELINKLKTDLQKQ